MTRPRRELPLAAYGDAVPVAATAARERLGGLALSACGLASVVTTLLIFGVLLRETLRFFASAHVGLTEFLFGDSWSPLHATQPGYGVAALLAGTALVTGIALSLATPLGVLSGIHLAEFASPRVARAVRAVLESLAGVPTVVLGFVALHVLSPALVRSHLGFGTFSVASAGLMVGLLVAPTVCAAVEDAIRRVPDELRDGAFGLGASRLDVIVRVVLPAAAPGIVAGLLGAAARCLGETMIVTLAAGLTAQYTLDPRDGAQTLTGYVAQVFLGEASHVGPAYLSCYAVAFLLFVLTFGMTVTAMRLRSRFRRSFE
ncbi:MAG: phosphate ABC transporter permease subunit PstC [Planctomycetes bacterium]|nr:phosphate ABC transporter permease subunit PstC [Planctomycetota bacterium]